MHYYLKLFKMKTPKDGKILKNVASCKVALKTPPRKSNPAKVAKLLFNIMHVMGASRLKAVVYCAVYASAFVQFVSFGKFRKSCKLQARQQKKQVFLPLPCRVASSFFIKILPSLTALCVCPITGIILNSAPNAGFDFLGGVLLVSVSKRSSFLARLLYVLILTRFVRLHSLTAACRKKKDDSFFMCFCAL